MRKILIGLLLATAAASPAMAVGQSRYDEERAERQQAREDRQKAREEQQQMREERSQGREERVRPEPSVTPRSGGFVAEERARPERAPRRSENFGGWQGRQVEQAQPGQEQRQLPARVRRERGSVDANVGLPGAGQRQQTFQQRRDQRDQRFDAMRQARIERQQALRNARPPAISRTPQPNTQPPPPVAARPAQAPNYHWNTNHWRKDKRYDWYKHRNKYWWLFQLGSYYDPFGWGYSPYQVGWRMWPSYYSSNFWINDPWYYRLPYAPPGTRWVRYWDDAILVDTWSGEVVDVIYNFFW